MAHGAAQISMGRGFAVSTMSEALPIDALQRIVELTRALGSPLPQHTSGLPYIQEKGRD